jgi:cytochrome oxidase Cu insertion factor (SCO1/SenC/PrrC family)
MTINHTSGLYVIDKQGNMRLFVDQDFKPGQLASYLSSQSLTG